MNKFLLSLLIFFNILLFAKPIVVVSIVPEKTFIKKIAKDKVSVTVMVQPGNSPHTYEPKPSQMIAISKSKLYFSMGVEFEETWVERFKSQNPSLKFINLSSNITKIPMTAHHHHGDKDGKEESRHHNGLDPHIWTSPKNVSIMAETIYKALVELDPSNEKFYESNLNDFLNEIKKTDQKIKTILKELPPKAKFMVFHPSWGYFAHDYNLVQIAVEVEGKKPKPKEMVTLMKEAKEENVRVIFTQPEFSNKSAKIIARELHIPVEKISPLSPNWSENLINMAKKIAKR